MPKIIKAKPKGVKKESAAEERHRHIAEAAYFLAEKRGFAPGCEWQDWLEAEIQLYGPAPAPEPAAKAKRVYVRRAAARPRATALA
jgi:Protein of unknown function (DUF2934)